MLRGSESGDKLFFYTNLINPIKIILVIVIQSSTETFRCEKRGWDKSPSLSIVFGLSSKTQWLSGLYYADFISFYSPTQLCGGGTTKSNSNELPISVPLSYNDCLSFKERFTKWCCFTSFSVFYVFALS